MTTPKNKGGAVEAGIRSRFEDKVIPEPNSGCWLWTGALVPDGYGSFRVTSKLTRKAHRVSFEIFCHPIPDALQVLHRCDTRACVNPDHLFLGSNSDNVADRVAKGRSASVSGEANGNWTDGRSLMRGKLGAPRGERVGNAKLTEAAVLAIRSDDRSQSAIARDHGVTQTLISQIKRRKVWTHV